MSVVQCAGLQKEPVVEEIQGAEIEDLLEREKIRVCVRDDPRRLGAVGIRECRRAPHIGSVLVRGAIKD